MGEYLIEIKLKYGEFTVKCNTYSECMEKYKEIKEDYKNVPCKIVVTKKNQIQFIKENKNNTMESLYNELKNVMIKIGQHQLNSIDKEIRYQKTRNELYHNLEETDLCNMNETEKANYLDNMKLQLTKRRLIENENRCNFAFYNCYNAILSAMKDYKTNKKAKENLGQQRFNNKYYTEDIKVKQENLNKLINEL